MSSGPSDYGTEVGAAQILKRLSEYTSVVVRQELRRAQLEGNIQPGDWKARDDRSATASLLAWFAAGSLVTIAAIGLAQLLAPWIAALVMWMLLLTIATALTLDGRRRDRRLEETADAVHSGAAEHDL